MSLSIGSLVLDNIYFSAPIAGYSDLAYRSMVKGFGCGLVWSEVIMARGLTENNNKTFELLRIEPKEHPIVIQLGGGEPDIIAQAARIAQEHGADAIDINCGCPVPKMVKRGYGAGLMKTPDTIARIVESVKNSVSIPVMLKIRAGFSKQTPNAVEVAKLAESAGACAVTVHGRFRDEFFFGKSNWDFIENVKSAVKIPVIGNGDIHNNAEAKRMIDQTKCDAVMIGRASIGNPWIFKSLNDGGDYEPHPDEAIAAINNHANLLISYYGETNACFRLRSLLCHYTKGIRNIKHVRQDIIKIKDKKDFNNIMDNISKLYFETL